MADNDTSTAFTLTEDPFTDAIGAQCPDRVILHRSRFEVDLNRDREGCVYRRPRTRGTSRCGAREPLAQ